MFGAFLDIFFPEATVGVRCNLCGWQWKDPNASHYYNKDKANRMFKLHIQDRHPQLCKEEEEVTSTWKCSACDWSHTAKCKPSEKMYRMRRYGGFGMQTKAEMECEEASEKHWQEAHP